MVTNVNVVGHASPVYKQRYVDPNSDNSLAYNYNMLLSARRSTQLVKYITSRYTGKFKFKNFLRQKIAAIGRGYVEPVKREPASAISKKKQRCGDYDCEKSRRVEITFTLKENKSAYEVMRGKRLKKNESRQRSP